jgi:O-acetyl-ADP-ribose deacetylase (regulator of RNase III)
MSIEYVSGDLFVNRFAVRALAHGCNCQGSMGAGIATGFRDRYPAMYAEYHRRCKATPRAFNPGDCWLWKAEDGPWVFNLGTQEKFWRARASYEAIEAALGRMRELADRERVTSIAVPRIGTGYGGLSWKKVRALIEKTFDEWAGTLYVYENYAPEDAGGSSVAPAKD